MKRKRIRIYILLIVVLYIVGSLVVSYKGLKVTRYRYASEKIEEPVRIVWIADLHDSRFGRGNVRLVNKIRDLKPDLICMVGDFMETEEADAQAAVMLADALTEVAPTYFAWGNQELAYMERTGVDLAAQLEAVGVPVLEKEYMDLEIHGQPVRLGGLYPYAFALDADNTTDPAAMDPEVYTFLCEYQASDACKVMLSHCPEAFVLGEASKTWDVDLVLSGHDHGGQVIIPGIGGLWAGDQGYWPEYVRGLHKKDKIHIAITTGLGSGKELLPRFNNPPEIAVMDIE